MIRFEGTGTGTVEKQYETIRESKGTILWPKVVIEILRGQTMHHSGESEGSRKRVGATCGDRKTEVKDHVYHDMKINIELYIYIHFIFKRNAETCKFNICKYTCRYIRQKMQAHR